MKGENTDYSILACNLKDAKSFFSFSQKSAVPLTLCDNGTQNTCEIGFTANNITACSCDKHLLPEAICLCCFLEALKNLVMYLAFSTENYPQISLLVWTKWGFHFNYKWVWVDQVIELIYGTLTLGWNFFVVSFNGKPNYCVNMNTM